MQYNQTPVVQVSNFLQTRELLEHFIKDLTPGELIEYLMEHYNDELTKWEIEFLYSTYNYSSIYQLTEKQITMCHKIYYDCCYRFHINFPDNNQVK